MAKLDISPIKFESDRLLLLDQTRLPGEEVFIEIETQEDIYDAIKKLKVRGAPAIGVAAALGLWKSVDWTINDRKKLALDFHEKADYIASSRPTAVNLEWAINRMCRVFDDTAFGVGNDKLRDVLRTEAVSIMEEDIKASKKMGEYGLSLLKEGMGILTHCNAGTIATTKYGTCLAPVHLAKEKGMKIKVFADETRPLLQGARLTAWELDKAGIDVTLICDNMAATVMSQGKIDAVVVGCDRMAANGDGANKIGTMGVAILAKEYGIPFYMFVPTSTIDLNTKTGADIPIEERDGEEIYKMWYAKDMAPKGIKTFNPAFDVTPAKYITAVVTERGIAYPPYEESLKKLVEQE